MRIKVVLYKNNEITTGEKPIKTYQMALKKDGTISSRGYLRQPDKTEDILADFFEDYADNFLNEIK